MSVVLIYGWLVYKFYVCGTCYWIQQRLHKDYLEAKWSRKDYFGVKIYILSMFSQVNQKMRIQFVPFWFSNSTKRGKPMTLRMFQRRLFQNELWLFYCTKKKKKGKSELRQFFYCLFLMCSHVQKPAFISWYLSNTLNWSCVLWSMQS